MNISYVYIYTCFDYTMNNLKSVLQKYAIRFDFRPHRPPILGRWNVTHCNEQSHKKADMTNEDHCGVCDKMRYDYIEKNSHRDNENNRNLNP